MKNWIQLGLLVCVVVWGVSCTKVVVRAKEQKTNPVSKQYASDVSSVFTASQQALEHMEFAMQDVDPLQLHLETRWHSTTSDSHYMDLFGRKDFAVNQGAYYKLVVDAEQQGNYVGVTAYTVLKTVAGKLESSQVVEGEFFKHLDDSMRSPQIEVTNVGMTSK